MKQSAAAPRSRGGWRRGNPAGNPDLNLAPRCGARARSGEPCRAPAMANGRCRMHGGCSTGPRTAEGMARMIASRTTHGRCNAAARAVEQWGRTLRVRSRLFCTATMLRAYLPPELAMRLRLTPRELRAPVHPSQVAIVARQNATPCNSLLGGGSVAGSGPSAGSGAGQPARGRRAGRAGGAAGPAPSGRAAERLAALVEAERLAPWRQAIAVARAAKRAVRDSMRAAQDSARAARAGGATRTGWVRDSQGESGVVRHDPMQLSATLASGRAGPDAVGLRSDGEYAWAAGLGGVACPSPHPWSASRPKPARGEGEGSGVNAPPSGDSLLQREVAARAAGLRDRGDGQCQGEAASRLRPDSALLGMKPTQLSAALGPAMPEPATGRPWPTGACHRARPDGAFDPAVDPAGRRPGYGAVRSGEGPFRRGLLSSTACNAPMAHKVAALVGLTGGWMGRVTIRATQQAEPDRQAWMTEEARKRAAGDARRLRTRCMIRVEPVADIVRWDDLSGDGG